jgi:Sulfotransferase domain
MIWIVAALVAFALLLCSPVYLAFYFRWEERETRGMAYYGRSLAGRQALKRTIRWYSLPARPLLHVLAKLLGARRTMPSFDFEGVAGPPKVSNAQVFAAARDYKPGSEDVFVATQMRCGTTWMQQVVFQIVTRGQGDVTDPKYGHLYAISPWIDAVNSVSMTDAPLVGESPTRIIKCHLPTAICPYSDQAKYIYVARHPVSCFASIVDYNRSLLGPLSPSLPVMLDWYCSDRMYWLSWPTHVEGWWQWSVHRPNVLFVHFEEMKRDFDGVCQRVARFLGYQLTADERRLVLDRSSLQYMKEHEEFFEMAPPTMFSIDGGEFIASGKAARYEDVTPAVRARIQAYCADALVGAEYPLGSFYPDVLRSVREPGSR